MSTEVNNSHLMKVVATPLWGVCIFEAARSGRRTAPWLQPRGFVKWLFVTTAPPALRVTAERGVKTFEAGLGPELAGLVVIPE